MKINFMVRILKLYLYIKNVNHYMLLIGSVHGAPTGNTTSFDGLGLGVVGRKLEEYAYLCPGLFPWVNPGPATHESGMF